MRTYRQIIRAYRRALKQLPGSRKKNGEYRNYILNSIQETLAASPNAGDAEIRDLLGDPETVRSSYIESLSPEDLALGQRERRKKRTLRLAILTPVILLFGLFIYSHFFMVGTVSIVRPIDQTLERYVEYPSVIGVGGIFGTSYRIAFHEMAFNNLAFSEKQRLEQTYSDRCHIICTVTVDRGETVVLWTGSGMTEEGITKEVQESLVYPFHFRIQQSRALSGEAAERARQGEAQNRQAIEGMG